MMIVVYPVMLVDAIKASGHRTILVEKHEAKQLLVLLAPLFRRLLLDLDRIAAPGDNVRRALAVLKSFVGAVRIKVGEVDIGLDIEHGAADSGNLEVDLPNMFSDVFEAAQGRGVAVALLIDEIQYSPVARRAGSGRSANSSGPGPRVQILCRTIAQLPCHRRPAPSRCVQSAARPDAGGRRGVRSRCAGGDFRMTRGNPYFLHEWGYQAWNRAVGSPITLAVVKKPSEVVTRRLDDNFFRLRFDRLTPRE